VSKRQTGVVTAARRHAAQVHANRSWTCSCGKVCWGNGGKSSHQRACRTNNEERLAFAKDRLAKAEADPSYKRGFYVLVDMAEARRADIARYEANLAAITVREAKRGGK
jgi:hypothetical protein